MREVQVSVPGKLILAGEHAAVRGCPAVTSAVDLRCRVRITPDQQGLITLVSPQLEQVCQLSSQSIIHYSRHARQNWQNNQNLNSADAAHLLKCATGEVLETLPSTDSGFMLEIASDIPLNAGFGSSAALAVASVSALLLWHRQPLSARRILHLAGEAEKRQHGRPSGIDHHTVYYGGTLQFQKLQGELHMTPLNNADKHLSQLRIFHSGTALQSTGETVTAVADRLKHDQDSPLPAMISAAQDLAGLLSGIELNPPALSAAIRQYQRCLEALGVVPENIRQLINHVESKGGVAKISGAGALHGPHAGCLLVLCPLPLPHELTLLPEIHAALAAPGLIVERNNG